MNKAANQYCQSVHELHLSDGREEALTGRALVDEFSAAQLESRLVGRLDELTGFDELPELERVAHATAAQHLPTIWAAFQLAVQTRLQRKGTDSGDDPDGGAWRNSSEWRVFVHLQRHASPAKASKGKAGTSAPRETRAQAARARDAARRASLVKTAHQPHGARVVGKATLAWLRKAADGCAVEYCALVAGVRAEQLSGLVDVLGAGSAGTSAVLSALNAEAVSEDAVTRAAGLLAAAEGTEGAEGAEGAHDEAEAWAAGSVGGELEQLHLERILTELRPRFGVLPLVQRFNALLDRQGPQPPLAEGAPAGLDVRGHVPTLWACFTRSVRLRLQARLGDRWSEANEWRVLTALYAEAREGGVRWQLSKGARRAPADPHQHAVGRWQRGPSSSEEKKRLRQRKLRPVGHFSAGKVAPSKLPKQKHAAAAADGSERRRPRRAQTEGAAKELVEVLSAFSK